MQIAGMNVARTLEKAFVPTESLVIQVVVNKRRRTDALDDFCNLVSAMAVGCG